VVFTGSSTGWRFTPDGLTITALTVDEVKESLTHVVNDVYCVLDPTRTDATPVPYLDVVPPYIECYPWQNTGSVGPQPGVTTAMD
jgi:hypothetical protein